MPAQCLSWIITIVMPKPDCFVSLASQVWENCQQVCISRWCYFWRFSNALFHTDPLMTANLQAVRFTCRRPMLQISANAAFYSDRSTSNHQNAAEHISLILLIWSIYIHTHSLAVNSLANGGTDSSHNADTCLNPLDF